MISKRFNPDLSKLKGIENVMEELKISEEASTVNRRTKQKVVEYLLYGIKSENIE